MPGLWQANQAPALLGAVGKCPLPVRRPHGVRPAEAADVRDRVGPTCRYDQSSTGDLPTTGDSRLEATLRILQHGHEQPPGQGRLVS